MRISTTYRKVGAFYIACIGLISSFENCFRIDRGFGLLRPSERSCGWRRVHSAWRQALNGSKEEGMTSTWMAKLWCMGLAAGFCSLCLVRVHAFQASSTGSQPAITERNGAHDFDFLIGNWRAHVRRLPDRLNGSDTWDVYDGISNHKKLLDSNANFEEFEVDSPEKHLHIKAQTLSYNPDSHRGASICSISTTARSALRQLSVSSTKIGENFFIKRVLKDG